MPYILVKQRAENIDDWKAVFEDHADARAEHGIAGGQVFQTTDDPNVFVTLFECDSSERVQAWIESDHLREGWNEAGVTHTETLFLTKIEDVDIHSHTDSDKSR
jgi:heme-degrading monooxygenase HmoA